MKRAQPGWLVLALAGIAAAIGSFLPFYTFTGGLDLTVWNRSLFPTATLIPALVVGIGLEALFVLLMGYEPRSPFLNFTWSQARLAGSAFAIVLALGYLVQGRAGASLGTGYMILALSTLATLGGAVMTRRVEIARGHEEIVKTEHPWRAAVLRWRREMSAKVQAYASGGSPNAQPVQPVSDAPDTQKAGDAKQDEAPDEKPEEPSTKPTPLVRLSAVQSEPDTEEKTEEKAAKADVKTKEKKPAPAGRKRAKQEAKKTVPQIAGSVGDASPAKDVEAEAEAEPKPEADAEAAAKPDAEVEASGETKAEAEADVDDEVDEERERPAAPG